MKKLIIIIAVLVALYIGWDFAHYRLGCYLDFNREKPVSTFMEVEGEEIFMIRGGTRQPYEIRGVNLGSGIPGEWPTDFAADKETYLRWFAQMQELGANTLRIYTIQADDFYEAFYEYNKGRPDPLYLIQGVWVNDYIQNSHRDAYHKDFFEHLPGRLPHSGGRYSR